MCLLLDSRIYLESDTRTKLVIYHIFLRFLFRVTEGLQVRGGPLAVLFSKKTLQKIFLD